MSHPSHWGKICFVSTPDGEICGLIKNLASTGLVSTSVLEPFIDKLLDRGMEELADDTSTALHGKNFIFLDGELVGVCQDSASFVAKLRSLRRRKDAERKYQTRWKLKEMRSREKYAYFVMLEGFYVLF